MSAATRKRRTVRVIGGRGPGRAHRMSRNTNARGADAGGGGERARAPVVSMFARALAWLGFRRAA